MARRRRHPRLTFDVVIVGGGPAGGAAAIACAGAGLKTLLLERSPEPRAKVGEALHPGVEPLLAELGVVDRLPEVTGARFPGVVVGWNAPPELQPFGGDERGPWLGFQLDRATLDAVLAERAEALGAEVRRGVAATRPILQDRTAAGVETETRETLHARWLVDASGPAAWLARRLSLHWERRSPRLVVRYGYAAGAPLGLGAAPELIADGSGWTWRARVSADASQWARLDLPGVPRSSEPPADFADLPPIGAPRGADATWRIAERVAGPGWFLTGEAACSVDPTSSKGVLKAMTSGLFAGRTIAAILTRGAPMGEGAVAYDAWLRRSFEADVAALAPHYAALGADGFGAIAEPPRRRLQHGA